MASFYFNDTLLIIGAGAHVPYAMPTSMQVTSLLKQMYRLPSYGTTNPKTTHNRTEQIRNKICEVAMELVLVAPPENSSAEKWGKIVGHEFQDFLSSFCESGVNSIDAYLSNLHNEPNETKKLKLSDFGRLAISVIISEHETKIPFGAHNDNWIEFIINKFIRPDAEFFFKSPPAIITFNYDRFLERRLFGHLKEYHKIDPATAEKKYRN